MRFLFLAQRDLIAAILYLLASIYPPSLASSRGSRLSAPGLINWTQGWNGREIPSLLLQTKLAGGQHMSCRPPLTVAEAQGLRAIRGFQEAPHLRGRQGPPLAWPAVGEG